MKNIRISVVIITLLGVIIPKVNQAQDINVKIGHVDSLRSEILKENRKIIVHLPDSYNESNDKYPVLYRLDGDADLMLETVSTVNRLIYSDEVAPEMIIVAIENTNRARDMWPVNTVYYPETEKVGAKDFLEFIEQELIPFIDKNYQTNQNRIICGQSLSGVFILYAFLTNPELFNSYIVSSGAFPGCNNYFMDLRDKSFQQIDKFNGRKIFITNGLQDPLDPDGEIQKQILDFSNSIKNKIGNKVLHKYLTYENEGHVPFHSLYDGLRFIFESNINE
ncbi:alpha/beta hydrolase [Bacteroidota bacterium]